MYRSDEEQQQQQLSQHAFSTTGSGLNGNPSCTCDKRMHSEHASKCRAKFKHVATSTAKGVVSRVVPHHCNASQLTNCIPWLRCVSQDARA